MTADPILGALHGAGVKRAEKDAPMAKQTSWRIGGPADYLCVVEDEPQLEAAIAVARDHGLPWLVMGGGNNVLVADRGIEGLVILNRLRGIAIEDGPQVACGAGVFFARAAQFTAKRGYAGMEWGIAIPGTVGGGVVNNAGAHGSDIRRSLVSADLIDSGGKRERVTPEDLSYRYRQSSLKTPFAAQSRLVVTSCRFRLRPDSPEAATARVEDLRSHRLRTQPVKEASAGSTFKNPEGGHAGALIDQAGLKGYQIGDAQIAPLHANFILNHGGATARDVVELIRLAQQRVWEDFGVRLEPEVQFVGRWADEPLRAVLEPA
jgi:UDP-N-acetylmuramate dehydrogenase